MSETTRDLIIQALQIIIQLVVVVLSPFIYRFLKDFGEHFQTQVGKANYEKYSAIVKDIVYSIEQLYPNMAGVDKYKAAIYAINERIGTLLTDKELETLIEAAVAGINLSTKGTTKKISQTIS